MSCKEQQKKTKIFEAAMFQFVSEELARSTVYNFTEERNFDIGQKRCAYTERP